MPGQDQYVALPDGSYVHVPGNATDDQLTALRTKLGGGPEAEALRNPPREPSPVPGIEATMGANERTIGEKGRSQRRDWLNRNVAQPTTAALPYVGATAGGAIGGIPGAALGMAAGEAAKGGIEQRPPMETVKRLPLAAAQGAEAEMGGQIVGAGLGAAGNALGRFEAADTVPVPGTRGAVQFRVRPETPVPTPPTLEEAAAQKAATKAAQRDADIAAGVRPAPKPSPFSGMTSTAGRPSVAVSGGYTAPEPVISIREPKGAARVAPRGSNGQEPLVLTPEEARSEAQLQRIATSRASERGMQYAGGVRTAGPNRVANRLFPAGVTRDFGVEAPATPRTARPSPVPISEPAVAAREYAAANIPSPDTLADRMVAKGMDPNFADRRAKDLVEAASGNGKWTGTERRVAENQIKNYMGPERRRP